MARALRVILRMVVVAACCGGGWATADAQGRWYQVEVIVFRNLGAETGGDEQWPELSPEPDYHTAQRLLDDLPSPADEPAVGGAAQTPAGAPMAFQSLSAGERVLGGIERALRTSGRYRPVVHLAWRQPGGGGARARRILVSNRAPGAALVRMPGTTAVAAELPYVEGTVRLRGGRQMHLDADLVFHGAHGAARLRESRAVRLREIHYFDHPLFGLLAQVTPYERPGVPPPGEAAAGTPATAGATTPAAPAPTVLPPAPGR